MPAPRISAIAPIKTGLIVAAILFAVTVGARVMSSAPHFFAPVVENMRNFEMFDSCYHVRRAEMTVKNYPHVPYFDTYHYYPNNPAIPWPMGYTLLLATLAKPLEMLGASRLVVHTLWGMLPAVFEGITVALFLLFFSRYMPFRVAASAALLLALSVVNTTFADAGYVDHHYFITFLMAVFAVLYSNFERVPNIPRAIALGAVVGAGVFFNVSSIQFSLLTLLAVAFLSVTRSSEVALRDSTPWVFGSALVTSGLSAFTTPVGRLLEFRYDQTSLFQTALIFIVGAFYVLVRIWLLSPTLPSRQKMVRSAALGLVALGLAGVVFQPLLEGARFLLVGNILNSIQGEEASIFKYYHMWPVVFGWFAVFAPVGLMWIGKMPPVQTGLKVLFFLFFGYGLMSGLSHFLYLQYFYPWYALAVAAGGWFVFDWIKKSFGSATPVFFLPFVLAWGYGVWTHVLTKSPEEKADIRRIQDTYRTMDWLRQNTPPTSDHEFGDGPPEYSVWAHRDYGHLLSLVARRAAVVSPFSTPDFLPHMKDYAALLFSADEDRVFSLMEKYQARYWVLDNKDNMQIDFMLSIVKDEPSFPAYKTASQSLPFLVRNNLLYFDGELRWRQTPGIKHFRLIYEVAEKVAVPLTSKGQTIRHEFNGLKVFERVAGAVITGGGAVPGERVRVALPLITNSGRRWTYTNHTMADAQGRYQLRVPYATAAMPGSALMPAAEVYVVESRGKTIGIIAVTDDAVRSGAVLSTVFSKML